MATPYIDPKRPRRVTASVRGLRAQQVALQAAQEAKREKYRLIVHGIIISLGVWAFRKTDIHREDPFLSSTLPLLDALFCVYLLALLFIEIWNRGNR